MNDWGGKALKTLQGKAVNLALTLLLFVSAFSGVALYTQRDSSGLKQTVDASAPVFNPTFTKQINYNGGLFSPFTLASNAGTIAMGEINGQVYAVVTGDATTGGVSMFSAIIRYEPISNSWTWVKNIYLEVRGSYSRVIFWQNRIIAVGQVICENANPLIYNYSEFWNRRKSPTGNFARSLCVFDVVNGSMRLAQESAISATCSGDACNSSFGVVGSELYISMSQDGAPSSLIKIIGFNANGTARTRFIRSCITVHNTFVNCSVPASPTDANRDFVYGNIALSNVIQVSRGSGNIGEYEGAVNATVNFCGVLSSHNGAVYVLDCRYMSADNKHFVVVSRVDGNTGQLLQRSSSVLVVEDWIWTYGDSISYGGATYFSIMRFGQKLGNPALEIIGDPAQILIYRATDPVNPPTPHAEQYRRNTLWPFANTVGRFQVLQGGLLHGFYAEPEVDGAQSHLLQNRTPGSGNTWSKVTLANDQFGARPHGTSLFYSESLGKLFAGNILYARTSQPGLWTMDFAAPPACGTMTWSGGSKSITLRPGETSTITLSAASTSTSGNAGFNFYDLASGAPVAIPSMGKSATMSGGIATLAVDYATLQASGRTTFQINGIVPGAGNHANCVIYVNIQGGACTDLRWANGSDSMTLRPGGASNITLTGSPNTLSGPATFDIYNRSTGQRINTVPGTMTNGNATINLSYTYLSALPSGGKNLQINGIVPFGSNDANCVAYVYLTAPPVINSSSLPTISCVDTRNPYSLRFYISTQSSEGNITRNTLYLLPSKTQGASIPDGYSSGPAIVVSSDTANGANLAYGSNYTVNSKTMPAAISYWTFTLNFDKNNPNGYRHFYDLAGGFDMYVKIEDVAGNNVSNGQIPRATLASSVDPFQSCAQLFYKTSNGDLRTYEPIAYPNRLPNSNYVQTASNSNKIWMVKRQTGGADYQYNDIANNTSVMNQYLSTYTSEFVSGTQSCTSSLSAFYAKNDKFCVNANNQGISQDAVLDQFAQNLNAATDSLKTINKADTSKGQMAPGSSITAYPGGAFYNPPGSTTLNIDVSKITADYSPLLIHITTFDNIVITDNTGANTPENLIIWCATKSCTMKVTNVTKFSTSQISSTQSNFTYPTVTAANTKGRIYFNYGSKNEPIDVPSTPSGPAGTNMTLVDIYNRTVSVPKPRKIVFDGVGTGSGYYLGGFMTSGYVYTDRFTSTNIVKGFIISRGIALRETASGNNSVDNSRNKFLHFKDFPNPFLHIDYDGKYLHTFRALFTKDATEVPREIIGL